jgi:DNA-binding transcriptional ArsR family regulator
MSIPDDLLQDAARRFALLADPTRLRVLQALLDRQEATVTELAGALGLAVPNVSQHLSRLLDDRIVGRRREGRSARFTVIDPVIPDLCALMCSSLVPQPAGDHSRQEATPTAKAR